MFGSKKSVAAVAAALGLAAAPMAASAQYPEHAITLIMPGSAGGSFDILTRVIADHLGERLGQTVVVENHPGASGNIATELAAAAEPDGYTFVNAYFGPFGVNTYLFDELPFDPIEDFEPIVLAGSLAYVLAVTTDSPFETYEQLVAYAEENPGELNYASAGHGTGGHIGAAMLIARTGLDMVHIPYLSAAPASAAVQGGEVDFAFEAMPTAVPLIQNGTYRPLAVTSPQRSALLPDVPTLDELGLDGYELGGWFGFAAPVGTPQEIIDTLNAEINAVLQMDEVQEVFAGRGFDIVGGTPDEFAAYIQASIAAYGEVMAETDAQVD